MRRYQVMVESEFPGGTGVASIRTWRTRATRGARTKGAPLTWIDEVDSARTGLRRDVDSFAGFEYLFWVGCAGALDDRAKEDHQGGC